MPSIHAHPRQAPLRLLYAAAALIIVILLAIDAAVVLHLRSSELDDEEGVLRNLSLTLAEQADRSFQSVDLAVASVVERIAAAGITDDAAFAPKLSGRDLHQLLQEKIVGIPQLDALIVVDHAGKVVNFSRTWPAPDIEVVDRDYFHALKDDPTLRSVVSAPVQSRASGSWTIYLGRRISAPDGRFLGVVSGAIQMRYFEDFYRTIAPADSTIVIQRLDGTMLVRHPPTTAIGKAFSSAAHLLNGGKAGTVREPSPIDGLMRLKAAHRLANYPVLVLVTKTEQAALATWRQTSELLGLAALATAIAIGIATFAVGRQWRQQAMLTEARNELRHQQEQAAALEAMRAAKEAAEAADRAKSAFLATMSHELRTPLNAVLGFSEVMVSEVFGPLGNERYRDYARDIHWSGSHLLSIINDVLDLSKASAGKLELVESWSDAREVVHAACRLIDPRIGAGRHSLTVEVPAAPVMLLADHRLLQQMLVNLLANACKFTPPGGRITCTLALQASGVVFAVADTGAGIPAEDLQRVLLPFVQIDASLSRRHEGTGLGLALVKAMAERHGGELRLQSQVGVGTTASIILPLARLRPSVDAIAADA